MKKEFVASSKNQSISFYDSGKEDISAKYPGLNKVLTSMSATIGCGDLDDGKGSFSDFSFKNKKKFKNAISMLKEFGFKEIK